MAPPRAIAVGLAAVALLVGCADPEPSTPTAEDLRGVDRTPDHHLTVDDDGYQPTELEIRPGEIVELRNDGTGPHSFTAAERFDTGRMEPGETSTLVLREPGQIAFHDSEAPDHEGTLTILAD